MSKLHLVTETFLKVGDQILNPAQPKHQDTIFKTLAAPDALAGINSMQAEQIVAVLNRLPVYLQVDLFTTPGFFPKLADNGQAATLAKIIGNGTLNIAQKTAILGAPDVKQALARNGQRLAVVSILEEISAMLQPPRPGTGNTAGTSASVTPGG